MKPKPCRPKQFERYLRHNGFTLIRQVGSHATFAHPDGRKVTLAFHGGGKTIPLGTLRDMLKSIGVAVEQYNEEI